MDDMKWGERLCGDKKRIWGWGGGMECRERRSKKDQDVICIYNIPVCYSGCIFLHCRWIAIQFFNVKKLKYNVRNKKY